MRNLYYLFIALLLFGCSASREIGKESTVETSGSKPDWLNQRSRVTEKFDYIRGNFTGATFQSDGEKASMFDAANELRELVGSYMSNIGGSSGDGSPRSKTGMSYALKSANIVTGNPQLVFNNFKPEVYWEKIEKTTITGVEYFYKNYVLVEIAKTDYNQILERIINGGIKESQALNDRDAKKFLEETLQKHLEKLK